MAAVVSQQHALFACIVLLAAAVVPQQHALCACTVLLAAAAVGDHTCFATKFRTSNSALPSPSTPVISAGGISAIPLAIASSTTADAIERDVARIVSIGGSRQPVAATSWASTHAARASAATYMVRVSMRLMLAAMVARPMGGKIKLLLPAL